MNKENDEMQQIAFYGAAPLWIISRSPTWPCGPGNYAYGLPLKCIFGLICATQEKTVALGGSERWLTPCSTFMKTDDLKIIPV